METHIDDPEIIVEDPQIAEAKASMFARMDELSRRFSDVKEKLDVGARIAEHPLAAAGIALAAGLLLGTLRGGSSPRRAGALRDVTADPSGAEKAGIATAVIGVLGTMAFRLVKDAVLGEVSTYAKSWWEKQQAREAGASHAPETAAFFKH